VHRALTFFNNQNRKFHAIEVELSLKSIYVGTVNKQINAQYGDLPERIQVDNGYEFISKDFYRWAHENSVVLDYSRLVSQTDNPFIESFYDNIRD